MERTLKLHFFNIKRTYLYAALFMYGILALFWLIALLVEGPEFYSIITTQPTWLALLTFLFLPFTFLGILYPVFDGFIFFDTSLRVGISRTSYFIIQIVTYILVTLITSFANGLTEIPWTGSTSTYFSQLIVEYFSFNTITFELINTLALVIIMLAVYRFKVKALIPFVFLVPLFGLVAGVSYSVADSTFLIDQLLNVIEFIMNNTELFMSMVITVLIGIYYLMVSKIEVQD